MFNIIECVKDSLQDMTESGFPTWFKNVDEGFISTTFTVAEWGILFIKIKESDEGLIIIRVYETGQRLVKEYLFNSKSWKLLISNVIVIIELDSYKELNV